MAHQSENHCPHCGSLIRKPRSSKRLTDAFCRNVRAQQRTRKYGDADGLALVVRPTGAKSWVWRGTVRGTGERIDRGLGPYPLVSLREARRKALDCRRAAIDGKDPRESERPTFETALDRTIREHSAGWKAGSRNGLTWRREFERYVLPRLGSKPIDRVTRADVKAVLLADGIWQRRPVLGKRLRRRISAVMRSAIDAGHLRVDPAAAVNLPKTNGVTRHHDALPHGEVAAAVSRVRASHSRSAVPVAFEFLVLTAARTGEVRGARWDEIDLDARVWTVPAGRMKAKREHRVPLSDRAVEVLREARRRFGPRGLVFPGRNGSGLGQRSIMAMLKRRKIPATVHGFRASFRVWCGDSGQARELAEAALAHVVPNPTEAAYARGTMFERRRGLMDAWAAYLAGNQPPA